MRPRLALRAACLMGAALAVASRSAGRSQWYVQALARRRIGYGLFAAGLRVRT